MKFLVDAQLPRRIVYLLRDMGYDAAHTLDLPLGNRTPDADIIAIAAREGRAVVTKDADFVTSFVLRREPHQLLLVSTGNIRNVELEALFATRVGAIVAAFDSAQFVELTRHALIIRA